MHHHGNDPARKQRFKQRLEILRDSNLHQEVRKHLAAKHWNRRQWLHASLFASIGVMLATIVPGFSSALKTSVLPPLEQQALALPALQQVQANAAGPQWQTVVVQPKQTLGGIFQNAGAPPSLLTDVLADKDAQAALRHLHPGSELAFLHGADGEVRGFRYDRDPIHRVELTVDDDGRLHQNVLERESTTREVVISGKVGDSLWFSARKLGLTPANINALTDDIFKYDIDFSEDVAATDRFSVVVEQTWREGELVQSGPIEAATFTAHGKLYSAFRFGEDGKAQYYSADGRPLKKAFIRMPVTYTRISSTFGMREHPILGRMRAHKGIDFAAPMGTPIMAAGDARVVFVGQQNGYGNVVILDHGHGYTTLYGHMSRFGKEHVGQQVAQGTVIGYVGMTGLATGPHLHYEFRVNGEHRNPLSVTMPPPEPLAGAQMTAFRNYTADALTRIHTVESAIYADAPDTAVASAAKPGKGRNAHG